MISGRPRYARINKLVNELLAGVSRAPVQVEQIAKNLGASIFYRDFDENVSGLLIRQGNSAVIGVAKQQSKERQRFTIAHELGHLSLHEAEEIHIDKQFRVHFRSKMSSTAADVREIEANAFAANLLMPKDFLARDVAKIEMDFEDPENIQMLSDKYGVSSQAMTFRLMNLFGSHGPE